MTTINITDLYDILVSKVGKTEAKALTNYIENKIEKEVESNTKHLATREDLADTKTDLLKWFIGLFITLFIMILGLYATILLKK